MPRAMRDKPRDAVLVSTTGLSRANLEDKGQLSQDRPLRRQNVRVQRVGTLNDAARYARSPRSGPRPSITATLHS